VIYSAHLLLLRAAVPWVVVHRSWIPCAVAQILRYIILYPPFFIIMWKYHCPGVVLSAVAWFQPDGWTVSAAELIPETALSSHHTAGAWSPVVCCAGDYDSRRGPVRRCECECDCASTLWALRGLARLRGAFARNSSANNRQAARGGLTRAMIHDP
jgi:hypothetical protein